MTSGKQSKQSQKNVPTKTSLPSQVPDDPPLDLSPEELERIPADLRKKVTAVSIMRSGPLPTPEEFKAYNDVLDNAAERIMAMAEKNLDARISNDSAELDLSRTHLEKQHEHARRGQWQSFILGAGMLTSGVIVLLFADIDRLGYLLAGFGAFVSAVPTIQGLIDLIQSVFKSEPIQD